MIIKTIKENEMQDLKAFRVKHGLSQVKMAKAIGVCLGTYLTWERGVGRPTPENMARLKAVLDGKKG